jgi:hypothetical protein
VFINLKTVETSVFLSSAPLREFYRLKEVLPLLRNNKNSFSYFFRLETRMLFQAPVLAQGRNYLQLFKRGVAQAKPSGKLSLRGLVLKKKQEKQPLGADRKAHPLSENENV